MKTLACECFKDICTVSPLQTYFPPFFTFLGGPLEMGDIEDMGDGSLAVICPWHSYDFNLKDGSSSTGLKVRDVS